ncbi:hypothetical protein NC796_24180 [Aliifodinibius sp. S!AR15-10]|uniref:hypothetical protein n=1 Tax=Aliifodinibius sp. S!AR15-10 TaxID=2950437 RepID=UPI00285F393D|nr:hypothetical protein [Aliifodinibius sp. S!AR15-10]MDR8394268.1 hypothetical protein [Aliifodinibius sp. S!AR15-10]
MKNKIAWVLTFIALTVGGYILAIYLPILAPGLYFDYQTEYKQYSIYSDRSINRGISFMMEEVTSKLQPIEIYSGQEEFSIYLCYEPGKYRWFSKQMNMNHESQGMTVEPLGYVFINLHRIGKIGQMYGDRYPYSLISGKATHIITHELMHVLITRELGMLDSRKLPDWKREGYAEYGASLHSKSQDTSYSFRKNVNAFLNGYYDEVKPIHRVYLKHELMVEYLITVKGITFSRLMNVTFNQDAIWQELKAWMQQNHRK